MNWSNTGIAGGGLAAIRMAARWIAALVLVAPLGALAAPEIGHVFALAPAPSGDGVLVASEQGLYLAQPDGNLVLRAKRDDVLVALVADPADPRTLYASSGSGGLLRSDDGGTNWRTVTKNGPDSFGLLTMPPGGEQRIYGIADGIYRSIDGGKTWTRTADVPDKLISFAASATRLYAGTEEGLRVSTDDGAHWQAASMYRLPATMIKTAPNGSLYSFNWSQGLLTAEEADLSWAPLANTFGGQAVMVMAKSGKRLYAATHVGRLFTSADGGLNWQALGGPRGPESAAEKRGEKLFETNCQTCHGARGIGEAPRFDGPDQALAPALDDTAHAWHHSDEQLQATILEGSPTANSRMVGWKGRLQTDDVQDILAYMKSLWGERALRCQGAKHMSPGCMAH